MVKPSLKRLVRSVLPQKLKRRIHDTWEHLAVDPFSTNTKGITGTCQAGGAGFSNVPVILVPVEGREDVWDLENRQGNMVNLKDLTLKFDFYRGHAGPASHSAVTLVRIVVVWFDTGTDGTATPEMNFDDVITGERGREAGIKHVFYDRTFSLQSHSLTYDNDAAAHEEWIESHLPVYAKIRLRGFGSEFDGDGADDYINGQAFLMMTCNSPSAVDGNGVHVQTPSTYRLRYYG